MQPFFRWERYLKRAGLAGLHERVAIYGMISDDARRRVVREVACRTAATNLAASFILSRATLIRLFCLVLMPDNNGDQEAFFNNPWCQKLDGHGAHVLLKVCRVNRCNSRQILET